MQVRAIMMRVNMMMLLIMRMILIMTMMVMTRMPGIFIENTSKCQIGEGNSVNSQRWYDHDDWSLHHCHWEQEATVTLSYLMFCMEAIFPGGPSSPKEVETVCEGLKIRSSSFRKCRHWCNQFSYQLMNVDWTAGPKGSNRHQNRMRLEHSPNGATWIFLNESYQILWLPTLHLSLVPKACIATSGVIS